MLKQNSSEVARLLAQVRSEYEAAHRALSGLAQGVSKHTFLIKRQENIAALHNKLHGLVGDSAIELICEVAEEQPLLD